MRKLLALLLVFGIAMFSGATDLMAQDPAATDVTGYQILKKYFIDGDWRFMSFVLICLILGLAFCIERIITLNIASANTDKLLTQIDDELKSGNIDGAMAVEKSIVSYGAVQMGLLEKGLVWISLFIAIAPMLGFMGTVIGMIQAFDEIARVGDLSPAVVAGGIKVALLTTVFGLISAIILQIFYNYIISKIDGIVNKMEDASIALVDIMASNNVFKSGININK